MSSEPNEESAAGAVGDTAFEVLVREHHRRLMGYALSLVRQENEAKDIVQDAFVVAVRKMAEFDAARDFGAWMRGIIRLKYLEWTRSRKEVVVDNETLESIENEHAAWDEAVADGRADAFEALGECVEKLTDAAKMAVTMFYMEHKSCSIIATVCGVTAVTVFKRLQRARDELADCVRNQTVTGSQGNT
jgi:RNA polymerase sigma-70 factor (ECF subfamily)